MKDQPTSRPIISKAKISDSMSSAEFFQNSVVRPIIKMKHDLLVAYMKNYIIEKHDAFNTLSDEKKIAYITSVFQKDSRLRAELRGFILGNLESSEYISYLSEQKDINKRIIQIIKKRIISHINILSSEQG